MCSIITTCYICRVATRPHYQRARLLNVSAQLSTLRATCIGCNLYFDEVNLRICFWKEGSGSVRTRARGAPNFPGPRAKSPPHPTPRGEAGHLSDRAGRGGATFLAPRLIPRSRAPLFMGPRLVHHRNFIAYLPIAPFVVGIYAPNLLPEEQNS